MTTVYEKLFLFHNHTQVISKLESWNKTSSHVNITIHCLYCLLVRVTGNLESIQLAIAKEHSLKICIKLSSYLFYFACKFKAKAVLYASINIDYTPIPYVFKIIVIDKKSKQTATHSFQPSTLLDSM